MELFEFEVQQTILDCAKDYIIGKWHAECDRLTFDYQSACDRNLTVEYPVFPPYPSEKDIINTAKKFMKFYV
jgi:hypothetical protein